MTRVLIVEDQKMAQENMEAIVQSSEDYILAGTISNAADAELVCMHKPVDLILMDMNMPVMNGCEATKAIRSLDRKDAKSVFIIALTANAFAEDVSETVKAGMNAHLAKPANIDLLCKTLARLAEEKR